MKSVLLALLVIFSSQVLSVEVLNLYQYSVEVDDKSRQERDRGSKNALLGVLKKVSGKTVSIQHSEVKKALRNSANFMLKYEYSDFETNTLLKVIFEKNKVDELLSKLDIPVWGNRRPATLIWLAIEEQLQRELVTKDTYPQLKQLIEVNADKQGIPIITPLLDLEDRFNVSVSDVWANSPQPVINASSRYNPEKIVTARLYQPANMNYWQLDWQFTNDLAYQLNSLTGDKQVIVGQMIENVAQVYAQEYAVLSKQYAENEATILYLTGINNLTTFTLAKSKLTSISMVKSYDVVHLENNKITFKLRLSGDESDFIQALTFDKSFEKNYDPLSFEQITTLEYKWVGK